MPRIPARARLRRRVRIASLVALAALVVPSAPALGAADAPAADGAGPAESGGPLLGHYPMTRESSGTSWQPDASEMQGLHQVAGRWTLMAHALVTLAYTDQAGPRGDSQLFNESLLMLVASRAAGAGVVGLRAMGSLEPLNGARGYPLLFQTGETANGRDPLVDRQHPHNLVGELAATYSRALAGRASLFVYAGPVGEPALGPPAFMHRGASEDNPEAPLTHHWLDATHVSFGVVTVGAVWHDLKLEGSAFNGREPDQHRYEIELRGLDSGAVRLSLNPTPALALQLSHARLASPEQLEPTVAVRRTTASATLDRAVGAGHWQTLIAWGRNAPDARRASDGWLIDSALALGPAARLFGRLEQVDKDELFTEGALAGKPERIEKLSIGYVHEFEAAGSLRIGVGGVGSLYRAPAALDAAYGRAPRSLTLFVRVRLAG